MTPSRSGPETPRRCQPTRPRHADSRARHRLVTCQTYAPSGKLLKSWGPAQTATATTCPTAAAPTPITDYVYDDLDRLAQVTKNLTAAEGGNRVTQTTYFADDRVQTVQRAIGTALAQTYASFTYTPNGLPATMADAKGNLTTTVYDGHDRKTQTRYPDKATPGLSSPTDLEQYAVNRSRDSTHLSVGLEIGIGHTKWNGQALTLVYDNLNGKELLRAVLLSRDPMSFKIEGQLPLMTDGQQIDRSSDYCVKHQGVLEHVFPNRIGFSRQRGQLLL